MAEDIEIRQSNIEVRNEGRRLMGNIMLYGEISPSHRERFEVRSLHPDSNVVLNLEHDEMVAIAWHPGGGLTLENDERSMRMVAELPPIPSADAALRYVRTGEFSGLSVEFVALRERRDADGIRVVEEAVLKGVGLVKNPSYDSALVEARKRLRTIRGISRRRKFWSVDARPAIVEKRFSSPALWTARFFSRSTKRSAGGARGIFRSPRLPETKDVAILV